jgi:hypothetical protein
MATLEANLIEDMGGPGEVTTAQLILVKQATHTAALASSLLAAVVKAGPGTESGQKTAHTYLSVLDRQHRALAALGIEPRTTATDPYLVIERAVADANRGDQGDNKGDDSQPNDSAGTQDPDPDEIASPGAAQVPDDGHSPANGTRVMAHILAAAEVRA